MTPGKAGMQGAGVGLVLGGLLHKGMDSAMIAHELKKKYGIDFARRSDLQLDELPQEAQELCERLDENTEDMETYLEAGLVAGAMGQAVYEAGALLSAVGATVAEKSKNAFQNLKRWFNQTFKGGNTTLKPNQVHHFATNKSKKYTSQFENITKKYGLDLDGDWNKALMPHQGRHPNAYHDYVLDNMQKFDRIAQGDQTKFLKLFEQMKQKIINNPDMLYKDYWEKQ